MRVLYLDIDGVFITAKNKIPALNLSEFIDFILENFDCYWLTTHCKGEAKTALDYLAPYLDAELLGKLSVVKPTNWTTLKTEAIDFNRDFYWLDDSPFQAEMNMLKLHGVTDRVVVVNLGNDSELMRIKNIFLNIINS